MTIPGCAQSRAPSGCAAQPCRQSFCFFSQGLKDVHKSTSNYIPLPWLLHQSHSPRGDRAKCSVQSRWQWPFWTLGLGVFCSSPKSCCVKRGKHHKFDTTTGSFLLEGKEGCQAVPRVPGRMRRPPPFPVPKTSVLGLKAVSLPSSPVNLGSRVQDGTCQLPACISPA